MKRVSTEDYKSIIYHAYVDDWNAERIRKEMEWKSTPVSVVTIRKYLTEAGVTKRHNRKFKKLNQTDFSTIKCFVRTNMDLKNLPKKMFGKWTGAKLTDQALIDCGRKIRSGYRVQYSQNQFPSFQQEVGNKIVETENSTSCRICTINEGHTVELSCGCIYHVKCLKLTFSRRTSRELNKACLYHPGVIINISKL